MAPVAVQAPPPPRTETVVPCPCTVVAMAGTPAAVTVRPIASIVPSAAIVETGAPTSSTIAAWGVCLGVALSAARAVMTYQKQARLNQTGVVDEITWHFLMDYGKGGNYGKKDITRLLNIAMRFGGVPYVWGGETPAGFDCSGFVQYVFRQIGINLPRTADVQYELGRKVLQSELQPGDLVFFETYEPGASHNGIYVGDGNFIGANSGTGVAVASLASPYWSTRYLGARRLF